jgi:hypothetical protein
MKNEGKQENGNNMNEEHDMKKQKQRTNKTENTKTLIS